MAGKWTKRVAKAGGYGAAVLVVLLAVGVTMTVGWRPVLGPRARAVTARRFEPTAARLERGRYLTEHVAACFACHSQYDLKSLPGSYPPAGMGGGDSMEGHGFRGIVAPNITPDAETGVGAWSDDELARAIREGVGRDGRALFPMMPYMSYRRLSDEDIASVVVYLRQLQPVRRHLPKSEIPFPVSRLINALPQPIAAPVAEPDRTSPVKYGEYLVTIGDCAGCHTPRDERGRPLAGLALGGGNVTPDGAVATANITPDATGIPYYDEALFLEVMRKGHVKARRLSPAMPWWLYRGMSDADLRAVFAYLQTVAPARHTVDNTEPPTPCKVCQRSHGGGERN
jgi:mono/diheme cytochrome c family protein